MADTSSTVAQGDVAIRISRALDREVERLAYEQETSKKDILERALRAYLESLAA